MSHESGDREWPLRPSAGTASSASTRARTSASCAARSTSSTRWRASARERLWDLLRERDFLPTLGAVTGNQAVQMVKAGLEGIYVSGWQVAADANLAGATYPDQSLYPANSVPAHVRRINNALLRADQITTRGGRCVDATGLPRSSPTPRPASAAR